LVAHDASYTLGEKYSLGKQKQSNHNRIKLKKIEELC